MKKIFLLVAVVSLVVTISCDTSFPEPVSFEDNLARDLEIIDNYIEENELLAENHESGIRYLITDEGTGDQPRGTDEVTVIYEVRLLDGTVVDSSTDGVDFKIDRLILAWQLMLPEMNEGGQMTMYAPSVYCYGSVQTGPIPPNSNLIFDIHLVEILTN